MAVQKGVAKPRAGSVTIVNQQGLSDWLEEQINKQMGHAKANRLGERLSIDPTKSISVSTINKWRRKELERMGYTYIIGIARYENCISFQVILILDIMQHRFYLDICLGCDMVYKKNHLGKPMKVQKGIAKPRAGSVTIVNQQGLSDWLEEQIGRQKGHAKANTLGERLSIDPAKAISVSTINKWRRKELERMDYTYIIGIARHENCTVDEIREWLEAPNGSNLKSFKKSQGGNREQKPDSVSVRWQVQDLIQQLQELDDLSHTEKLAVISAVTQPLEVKKKIQLPEPWIRILDKFPEELIPTLYELGASLPDWKEKVGQVFKREAVPTPSIISSVCFLLNLHKIELEGLSSEDLEALFGYCGEKEKIGASSRQRGDNN